MAGAGDPPLLFSDLALARRLERAEARNSADFVQARARFSSQSGTRWIEVAGAHAIFDGVASPLTQTFGLGLFQTVTGADLDAIEEFYRQRGAPVFHEVSPVADVALLPLLTGRGYQPVEFTSVMFRPIQPGLHLGGAGSDRIRVRVVRAQEQDVWAQTAAVGWGASGELAEFLRGVGRVNALRPSAPSFLAELDGQPIAAAAMYLGDGVALLAGASTIPAGRRRGAQRALLESRLRYGAERGCDLAMLSAQPPGGPSQRNAERYGFRIAYTRIKWQLSRRPASPPPGAAGSVSE
jgi:GNAT superfamily N-acetyltransferase